MSTDAHRPIPGHQGLSLAWIVISLISFALPVVAQGAALPQYDRVRLIDNPRLVPSGELTDQAGEPFQLAGLRGKVSLVFFGFTNCPDVCPMGMQRMRMLEESGEVAADKIAYVLISVDGQRDSPEVMKAFLEQYSPDFLGLTADTQAVKKIAKGYSVAFFKGSVNDADGSYSVSHSPQIFVVDPDGYARAEFYNADLRAMAGVVNAILEETTDLAEPVSVQREQ